LEIVALTNPEDGGVVHQCLRMYQDKASTYLKSSVHLLAS
jgi:hypothetical protein